MACANLPYFEIKPNARNVVMKHIQINDGQLGMKTVHEEIETLKMLYPENFKYALGLTGSGLTVYLALVMDVRLKQFVIRDQSNPLTTGSAQLFFRNKHKDKKV